LSYTLLADVRLGPFNVNSVVNDIINVYILYYTSVYVDNNIILLCILYVCVFFLILPTNPVHPTINNHVFPAARITRCYTLRPPSSAVIKTVKKTATGRCCCCSCFRYIYIYISTYIPNTILYIGIGAYVL